jgi:MinD-like ATPase involved in chromosome partitioning or flagellar assembly
MTTTIAVSGGKGGVGKTTIAVNLASWLARNGRQTLLVDADFGMANSHILCGLKTEQIEANEASSDPTTETVDAMTVINILEEVSINDMRFFAGSRVEVSKADADRLIKAGKAQMNAQ